MYSALWQLMPGPLWVRILLMTLLCAATLAALVFLVFPWLNTFVNVNDVTVNQ
jgi:uncharacterized membrane protein